MDKRLGMKCCWRIASCAAVHGLKCHQVPPNAANLSPGSGLTAGLRLLFCFNESDHVKDAGVVYLSLVGPRCECCAALGWPEG